LPKLPKVPKFWGERFLCQRRCSLQLPGQVQIVTDKVWGLKLNVDFQTFSVFANLLDRYVPEARQSRRAKFFVCTGAFVVTSLCLQKGRTFCARFAREHKALIAKKISTEKEFFSRHHPTRLH